MNFSPLFFMILSFSQYSAPVQCIISKLLLPRNRTMGNFKKFRNGMKFNKKFHSGLF